MLLVCLFLLSILQISQQDDGTNPTTMILTVVITSVAILLFIICMIGLFCYWYRGRIWPFKAEKRDFEPAAGPVTRRTHRHHNRPNCVHPVENNHAQDIALPIASIANINFLPPAYEQCEAPPPAYDSIYNRTVPVQ